MAEEPALGPLYRNGAGSLALIAGIVALVCAFAPFVGDFVAVPTGLVAVISGYVGLCRVDEGTAINYRDAVFGAAMGGAALFVVLLMFAASYV